MRRALFLPTLGALLVGCGSTPAPAKPHVPAEGDAVIVQKVLDGQLDPDTALDQVARSSGWPISTTQGFLFAIRDQGQEPYSVETPSGAFPRTALTITSGLAWAVVPIASAVGVDYRFVTGTGDNFSDDRSRYFAYSGIATLSYVLLTGKHLERWTGVGDTKMPARTLRVLVPTQPPTHFMLAHDGQNLFGPTPFGGWGLQTAGGPTTLVVGIDNTADRVAEYTPVDDVIGGQPYRSKGLDYADYVEHTVRPFIEAHYGTPARVGVMGSSLGGLISYVIKRRYPASYDFVASLSGTFGWGSIGTGIHNPTEIEAWAALGSCPAGTFYIDSGGGPGSGCVDADGDGIQDDTPDATDNYCENVQMRETLAAVGCGGHLTYVFASGAQHNEAAWHARAPAIFQLFEGG